jgi:hypothetical protein
MRVIYLIRVGGVRVGHLSFPRCLFVSLFFLRRVPNVDCVCGFPILNWSFGFL